jgi:MoaA/NifB/PqqE/SkfB family radical SAM enzyme
MYQLTDIRQLHIEASTRCNAECPMCSRNLMGRTSPGLAEESMSLDKFRQAVPADLVGRLEILDICGAYGDPAMAPDLIAICEHVRTLSRTCKIRVFSNGGIRSERWWSRLAAVADVVAVFAIDGVATNHVYRRRVDVDRVLRNAKAFIDGGGRAQWDYIVFEHNEHEVEAARLLSQSLGFESFSIKRTARFLRPLYEPAPELRETDGIDSHPIYNRAGQVVGELRPPRASQYVNEVLLWIRSVEQKASYLDSFFDDCQISCLALHSGSLYLSVAGHVYPCCWLYVQATLPAVYGDASAASRQVRDLLDANGGESSIDATTRHLDEILQSPFFHAVERSWSAASVAGGKLKVCARVCGKGFDAYRKQFERAELVP